jgi:hypothetical protein
LQEVASRLHAACDTMMNTIGNLKFECRFNAQKIKKGLNEPRTANHAQDKLTSL